MLPGKHSAAAHSRTRNASHIAHILQSSRRVSSLCWWFLLISYDFNVRSSTHISRTSYFTFYGGSTCSSAPLQSFFIAVHFHRSRETCLLRWSSSQSRGRNDRRRAVFVDHTLRLDAVSASNRRRVMEQTQQQTTANLRLLFQLLRRVYGALLLRISMQRAMAPALL